MKPVKSSLKRSPMNSLKGKEKNYATGDLLLACAIFTAAPELFLEVKKNPGNQRSEFIFRDFDKASAIQSQFYQRKLTVDARSLLDSHRELKSLVFQDARYQTAADREKPSSSIRSERYDT